MVHRYLVKDTWEFFANKNIYVHCCTRGRYSKDNSKGFITQRQLNTLIANAFQQQFKIDPAEYKLDVPCEKCLEDCNEIFAPMRCLNSTINVELFQVNVISNTPHSK